MNGIIVVDKPAGLTSHDVVLFIRRKFHIKKVGHAGTLDPMATGVLVLLLGSATKLSSTLISDDKEYDGIVQLGVRTDTYDSEGKVLSSVEPAGVSDKKIKEVFDSFRGTISQIPPMVSAIKHKGKKLYQLARKGIVIERKPRTVTIFNINIQKIRLPAVWFSVHCSKGTYIRKLADDIGERLGCGAHLTALKRTRSGRFSIEQAVSLDDLKRLDPPKLKEYVNAPA